MEGERHYRRSKPTDVIKDAAISMRGLTKEFGEMIAVNQIDLDIKKGELLVFSEPMELARAQYQRCLPP